MNPETDYNTTERETDDNPFADAVDGGNPTRTQTPNQDDPNRGKDRGQYDQTGNRTDEDQGGRKQERKDEGKETDDANR